MATSTYAITYDVGTTGVKTCLFRLAGKIALVGSAYAGYGLYMLKNGGAEQDPDEWWAALCQTTKAVLQKTNLAAEAVSAVSFCSQMQSLVLVGKDGRHLRPAMSYMDNRAQKQYARGFTQAPRVAGYNVRKLLIWLSLTKAAPTSIKDPLWKYKWVQENEPEVYSRIYKWLDVKDYLVSRFTGEMTMTEGSAYATFLCDVRSSKCAWSQTLCDLAGVDMAHLPPIIASSDLAGCVTPGAAAELGLFAGTAVYGGGGDAELIGVGVGAVAPGETHIYLGTSGWISTVTDKQIVDPTVSIAAIVGCQRGLYHYFAEMETAGKCLEWVKDHLALDEIGIYLQKTHVAESLESVYLSLYDYLCEVVSKVPPGSNGVIFTPWLHGNRCPFEDASARGMFFNIGIDTGKSALIRAVIEGIAYHCRLMLEAHERKLPASETIMVCGGGASSAVICQILADVLGRKVATLPDPQNVGALGAAVLIAAATGAIPSMASAKELLPPYRVFYPNAADKAAYDRQYKVFQVLHKNNKISFAALNAST